MKILILSGAGFLGQGIIRNIELTIPEATIVNTTSRRHGVQKGMRYVEYKSRSALRQLLHEVSPNFIVHLASSCLGSQTELAFRQGVVRDKNLISAIKDWDGEVKVIFVASLACFKATDKQIDLDCHTPESLYGKEKAQMVTRLKKISNSSGNIDVKIVYPSSIYGVGQRGGMFLPSLLHNLKNNTKMIASGSKKRRDYIHVSDVSRLIVGIINDFKDLKQTDILLNSGQLVELGEIAAMVCNILGRDINDVVFFEDSPGDINDYQSIGDSYKSSLSCLPSVSLFDGLREMFRGA